MVFLVEEINFSFSLSFHLLHLLHLCQVFLRHFVYSNNGHGFELSDDVFLQPLHFLLDIAIHTRHLFLNLLQSRNHLSVDYFSKHFIHPNEILFLNSQNSLDLIFLAVVGATKILELAIKSFHIFNHLLHF